MLFSILVINSITVICIEPRITDFGISKATPTHHCSSNKSTKSKLSVRPTTICQPRMEQLVEGVVSQGDDSVVKENISPLPVNQGGSGLIEDTPPVDVATNKKIVYDIVRIIVYYSLLLSWLYIRRDVHLLTKCIVIQLMLILN